MFLISSHDGNNGPLFQEHVLWHQEAQEGRSQETRSFVSEDLPKASQTTTISLWWQLPTHPSTRLCPPDPVARTPNCAPPTWGAGRLGPVTASCCSIWRQEEEALTFQELPLWDNLPMWSHLISLVTHSNSYLNNNRSYNPLNSSIRPFTHSAQIFCTCTWLQAIFMYWRYRP